MASSCLSHVLEIEKLEISPKPNWLELPRDITMNILQRLETLALVTSASVVCPVWWNICKDPLIWTTIDLRSVSLSNIDFKYSSTLEKICRYAVNRSCGHLKDIYIKIFGTDELLLLIANSASKLRCIQLELCHEISNKVLEEVVNKQPFLEELEFWHCFELREDSFGHIGGSCQFLKSLKFSPCVEAVSHNNCDDAAVTLGKTMSNLRHLTILNNELTNGLQAILDGCPFLESLDIRGCLYVDLDGSLGKRCNAQIKELRFPAESIYNKFDCVNFMNYLQYNIMTRIDFDAIDYSRFNEIPE
ncbi:unnamed protein product [Lathyrus oleraceus]|uniref:F-box domain-containing protein n=1 Tax=Pisum sativum TaxID=3888 RepID=A0A9D4Y9A8_PEA|nr:putative F-box/LRR-repeat protein 23 [Pisum sativum]KAI5435371.1 hypothetical protein KIW84_021976 [Pisum sativum]